MNISFPNVRSITRIKRHAYVTQHARYAMPISGLLRNLPTENEREALSSKSAWERTQSALADKASNADARFPQGSTFRRVGSFARARASGHSWIDSSSSRSAVYLYRHTGRAHESPPPRGRCRETQRAAGRQRRKGEGAERAEGATVARHFPINSKRARPQWRYWRSIPCVSGTRLVRAAARSPDVAHTRIPEVESLVRHRIRRWSSRPTCARNAGPSPWRNPTRSSKPEYLKSDLGVGRRNIRE